MTKIIILFLLISVTPAFAVDLTSEEMGFMTLAEYGYYVAVLGVVCGLAFVLGIKQ